MPPTESLEVQLARIEERLKSVIDIQDESRKNLKDQYDFIDQTRQVLLTMNNRLTNMENSFAKTAPTIEEFITIKHKVVGAGAAGKFLWGVFGGVIALVFALRTEIINWIKG